MKRLTYLAIAFGIFCSGIVFGAAQRALAAPPLQVATATPQNPPDTIACFVGDQLYVLPKWEPETTPTRIFTPTPLAEASRTPSPTVRPSATGTGACRAYVVKASLLNVRDQPNKTAKILRTLKLNDTVSLSALPQDSVTDTEGTVWRKLCQEASYLSQSWVSVK